MIPTFDQPTADYLTARALGDSCAAWLRRELIAALGRGGDSRDVFLGVVRGAPGAGRAGSPAAEPIVKRANGTALVRLSAAGGNKPALCFVAQNNGRNSASRWHESGSRVSGDGVSGRARALLLAALLRLLTELANEKGARPRRPLIFAVAENAAQAQAAVPPDAPVVWLDATNGRFHETLPGCVPFRCTLTHPRVVEFFPFVVESMCRFGNTLIAELPDRSRAGASVFTHFGRLGRCGVAPDVACERCAVNIDVIAGANPERVHMRMNEVINAAIAEYLRRRVDLRRAPDPQTGEPMLPRHYTLAFERRAEAVRWRVEVFGRSAHAGACDEADSAIAKAAFLFAALLRMRSSFPKVRTVTTLVDEPRPHAPLALEGIQTFAPPLTAQTVRQRLHEAAADGVRLYQHVTRDPTPSDAVHVAFPGPDREPVFPAGPSALAAAFRVAAEHVGTPARNDAVWLDRAGEGQLARSGRDVLIFGPGRAACFGADHESIEIPEIQRALATAAVAACAL
jgi:hypothetical protein